MKRDPIFAAEQALRGDLFGWLHDHTEEDEDGCLIWQYGYANHGQTPIVRLPKSLPNPLGRKTKRVTVYRTIWEEFNRKTVPDGKVVYRSCQKLGCVSPACLKIGSPKDVMKVRLKMGLQYHDEKTLVKMAAMRRQRAGTILDMEKVRAIRAEMAGVPIGKRTKAYHEVAQKYGITYHMCKKVATGQSWNESVTASPFRGMFTSLGL